MKKYIYLALIFACSIFLTFFLIELYKVNFITEEKTVFFQKPYYQLKVLELDNYLEENPRINIILINSSIDSELETKLDEFITETKILEHFIVINNKNLLEAEIKYLEAMTDNTAIDYTTKTSKILIVSEKKVIDFIEIDGQNFDVIENFIESHEDFND